MTTTKDNKEKEQIKSVSPEEFSIINSGQYAIDVQPIEDDILSENTYRDYKLEQGSTYQSSKNSLIICQPSHLEQPSDYSFIDVIKGISNNKKGLHLDEKGTTSPLRASGDQLLSSSSEESSGFSELANSSAEHEDASGSHSSSSDSEQEKQLADYAEEAFKFVSEQQASGATPLEVLNSLCLSRTSHLLPDLLEDQWKFVFRQVCWLFSRFYKSLRFCAFPGEAGNVEKLLTTVDLEGIARYILSGNCHNIIIVTGAGISTAAGIPDFRSPGSGLYYNLQKYNLPYPQAIFEIDFFLENPVPFVTLMKELYPGNFKPTISHYFIKLVSEKKLLLRNYTQNIDTLERVANIEGEYLVEAHGSFNTAHCVNSSCKQEYDHEYIRDLIFSDYIPICQTCKSLIKPDIVFFGESLPKRFSDLAPDVQPFASVVDMVSLACPRLLINREVCGKEYCDSIDVPNIWGVRNGFDFNSESNCRDVFEEGPCDDGFLKLADLLGWKKNLLDLYENSHSELDKKRNSIEKTKTSRSSSCSEGHITVKEFIERLENESQKEILEIKRFKDLNDEESK